MKVVTDQGPVTLYKKMKNVTGINEEALQRMQNAHDELCEMLEEAHNNAVVHSSFGEKKYGIAWIRAKSKEVMIFDDPKRLSKILKEAYCVEINAYTNGENELDIEYNDLNLQYK